MAIFIGVIGSLVASFVWWCLAQLYSFDSRKKINYELMLLRDVNALYEKCLEYGDYDLALSQSQQMLMSIGKISSSIKYWTYIRTKRKLVNTLVENLYEVISRFQRYYIGYDTEIEKERCCAEAKRHLYVVGFESDEANRYPDPNKFQSVSSVTIELLTDLNSYKTVKKILKESDCFNFNLVDIDTRIKYYLDLVSVNSFKGSYSKKVAARYQITNDILTKEEYEKLIVGLKN